MILRLAIAFTRWVWGISPAFFTPDSDVWYLAMVFGTLIDAIAVAVLIAAIVAWIQTGKGGAK